MLQPDIVRPTTIGDALQALCRPGAVALAGATDLIPAMRKGEVRPRLLVNLKHIPGLAGIRRTRGGIRIGALTRVADLLENDLIANSVPLLSEVASGFGSVQIRNLATVGGNLCNAAPSADLALPLLVLDARVEVTGPAGARQVELCNFFRGVNKTVLRRGEILTSILIPPLRIRTGAACAKLGGRRAMDLAFVGVAAALRLRPNRRTCAQARIALGSLAPTPLRAYAAEDLLQDSVITPALVTQAAEDAAAAARPVTDLRASAAYRREMTRTLTGRALREALRRAQRPPSAGARRAGKESAR